jgi:hypothetical protein
VQSVLNKGEYEMHVHEREFVPNDSEKALIAAGCSIDARDIFHPDDNDSGNLTSAFHIFCALARKAKIAYTAKAPSLKIVLVRGNYPKLNARAQPFSSFDAIVVAEGFIERLAVASGALAQCGVDKEGPWTRRVAELVRCAAGNEAACDVLTGLMYESALSYIFGHEVGHLANGHIGVNARPPSPAESKAREIDADIFGLVWSSHALERAAAAKLPNPNMDQLFSWIRQSSSTRQFVNLLGFVAAFQAMGLNIPENLDFTSGLDIASAATHPPSAMRLHFLLSILMAKAPLEDGKRTFPFDGILLAGEVLVTQTLTEHADREVSGPFEKFLGKLKGMSKETRAWESARFFNLIARDDAHAELTVQYFRQLQETWQQYEGKCEPRARFKNDYRFNWASSPISMLGKDEDRHAGFGMN